VDLHAHSTASDGAATPEALIAEAAAAGLSAIALTDHDTVAGVPRSAAAATSAGIRLVAGCELSAYDADREVHILALHVADVDALAPALADFREQRIARAAAMVDRLGDLGLEVTLDEVMREAGDGTVGRPHVARVLVRSGAVADFRDAFDRYLATGRPAYVEKPRLGVADAIGLAHGAGALAVWAHPGRDGTRERVARLADAGMDGLEIRHPGHSFSDTDRLRRLADDFGLVPSGGSDWHGATAGYRVLGSMHIPAAWLDAQDDRIAARGA